MDRPARRGSFLTRVAVRPAAILLAPVLVLASCAPDAEDLAVASRETRPVPDGPNLLLITIDTLRADYLGCYGSSDVRTPNLDRVAAEGTLCERHVAPSQCTNPAHATILTGLYLARHGVYDNKTPLTDHALTLAEILRERGYSTLGAVSARHLADRNSSFGQGFDEFVYGHRRMHIDAGQRNREVFKRLRRAARRPFFAWIHYFDPHGDYEPPRRFAALYPPRDEHEPVLSSKHMESELAKKEPLVDPDLIIPLYKGEISYVDAEVGRLLGLLDELGVADETLVVIVGDHGESMTEKGIYFCHAGMYNQVLHVPLLLRLPGRVPAGHRVRSVTGSVDILPTVLELLGVEAGDLDVDGRSLVPALTDPEAPIDAAVFSEAVQGRIRAVYADGFKFIQMVDPGWAMHEDHLYRPFADYWEEEDLKERLPRRAAALDSLIDAWLADAVARSLEFSAEGHELDADTERALRALGYIE